MVKFTVNDNELELFQNTEFPLSLNRALVDFKELGSRSGEFSLTVKLPNSEANRRVLEYYDNLTESNKFRKGVDNKCIIEANNVIIIIGLFFITAVAENEISGYVLAKTSSLNKLLDTFKLTEIVGLEYEFEGLSTIQENLQYHMANGASPEKLILFGMVAYGNYFIPNRWEKGNAYPMARLLNSLYGTIDITPREIFGNTTYVLNDNSDAQLDFRSLPPQVYIVAILKAIFNQIGYRLTGSWINGDEAKHLLMPFTSEKAYLYNYQNLLDSEFTAEHPSGIDVVGQITYDFVNGKYKTPTNSLFIQVKSSNFDFPTGATGTAADEFGSWYTMIRIIPVLQIQIDNTYSLGQTTFIAPVKGTYKVKYSFKIKDIDLYPSTPNTTTPRHFRKGFGISKFQNNVPTNLDGYSTLAQGVQNGTACVHFLKLTEAHIDDFFTAEVDVDLEEGEIMVFWISTTHYNAWTGERPITIPVKHNDLNPFLKNQFSYVDGGGNVLNNRGTPWTIISKLIIKEPSFKITLNGVNSNVNIAPNLPDVKCVDFVKSFIGLFNLYLNVDDANKTVYMDSFKDFYLGNDLAVDITERTQIQSQEVRPSDMASDYLFDWKLDDADAISRKVYNYRYKSKIDVAASENVIDSGIFCSTELQNFDALVMGGSSFVAPNFQSLSTCKLPRIVSDANEGNLSNEIIEDRYNFQPRLLWFDGFYPHPSLPNGVFPPIMHSGLNTAESLAGVVKFKFRNFQELFFEYYKDYLNGLASGYEISLSLSLNEFLWNELQINKPVLYEKVVYCIKEIKGYRPDGKNFTSVILFRCK